jgi:hypothetical protein
MSTIQCALYCKLGAKYSAQHPVYAIWTVVPDTYNVLTASHIQDSIFSWTYLRRYCRYINNSMCVILQTLCQIQRTTCRLRCVYSGPNHIQCNYSSTYSTDSIFSWTYLCWYWRYVDNSMCAIMQTWCQIQRTSSSLLYLICGPGHIQCNYSSAYLGFNIQVKVAPLLLEASRQCNARYTANLVPNTAHILQLTLSELWSRSYTM